MFFSRLRRVRRYVARHSEQSYKRVWVLLADRLLTVVLQVEYELVQGPKGFQAANLTGPGGRDVVGDPKARLVKAPPYMQFAPLPIRAPSNLFSLILSAIADLYPWVQPTWRVETLTSNSTLACTPGRPTPSTWFTCRRPSLALLPTTPTTLPTDSTRACALDRPGEPMPRLGTTSLTPLLDPTLPPERPTRLRPAAGSTRARTRA